MYLNRKKADLSKYKSSLAPAKILDENSSIRHLEPCENLGETYENLDRDVREAGLGLPVVVKEGVHTPTFENNMQRLRFLKSSIYQSQLISSHFALVVHIPQYLPWFKLKKGKISMRY